MRQRAALESLRAADRFLDEYVAELPRVGGTGARARLRALIAEADRFADEQMCGSVEGHYLTGKQWGLGRVLVREHMAPISLIARADLPDVDLAAFRMPRGKPTVERLKVAASEMARAAALHEGVFVAAGLPPDFIDRLEAAAHAFVASAGERTCTRARISGASTGIQLKLREGRRLLAVLDSFVRVALEDDSAKLTQWNVLKRVRTHASRRSAAAAPAAEPVAEPVAAPVAAPVAEPEVEPEVERAPASTLIVNYHAAHRRIFARLMFRLIGEPQISAWSPEEMAADLGAVGYVVHEDSSMSDWNDRFAAGKANVARSGYMRLATASRAPR